MSQKVFCKECNLVYNENDIERLHKIANKPNHNYIKEGIALKRYLIFAIILKI